MTCIPDTSEKYINGEPNHYYYDLLKGKDKAYLKGYDDAIYDLDHAFYNLGCAYNEYEYLKAGLDINDIDEEALYDYIHSDKTVDDFEHTSNATKLVMMLYDDLKWFIESDKDEAVVSMIDSMSEKRHEKRMRKVYGDEYSPECLEAEQREKLVIASNKLLRKCLDEEIEKREKYEKLLLEIQNKCLDTIELPFTEVEE